MTLRRIGLALLTVFALALGALAWRLDRGPIAVPFLVERIEAAYNQGGPGRIEVGAVRIAWHGWGDGGLQPMEILLSQVRALGPAGEPRLEVPDARVAIPLGGLLRGRLAPQRLELRNVLLRLQRDVDGNVSLGLGEAAEPASPSGEATAKRLMQALARPPQDSLVAALEHLAILDGRLQVDDRQLGLDWSAGNLFLALNRQAGGAMQAQASGDLAIGGETVPVRLTAALAGEPRRWSFGLSLPQVSPGKLAHAVPALAPLGLLDAPAEVSAQATLAEDGMPLGATVALQASPGGFALPNAGRVPFTALRLRLAAEPRGLRLEQLTLTLTPAPDGAAAGPTIEASGQAALTAGQWQAEADLTLDHAQLGALDTWWPANLAKAARAWVAENLSGGLLHDGQWHAAVTAPQSLTGFELTALSGRAELDSIAIRWHPQLPPLEELSGTLVFASDNVTLQAEGGKQVGTELRLSAAQLRLTGLGAGPTRAELQGRVTGPIADLWALAGDPRLGLLAGRDLPIHDPTGTLDAELSATVPVAGPAVAADPRFHVVAGLKDLRLPDVALGHTLDEGNFNVTVDRDGVRATGTGRFGGIPAQGTLKLGLPGDATAGMELHATASAHARAAQLADFGFDPGDAIEGPLGLRLRYDQQGGQPARLSVRADLKAARLSLPLLGYAKPPGAAAMAEAIVRLDQDGLLGLEKLRAEAPDLTLHADAETSTAAIKIQESHIGATHFAGTVQPPVGLVGPWRIALHGPVIDLRPVLAHPGGTNSDSPTSAKPEMDGETSAMHGAPLLTLEAQFDRALTPGAGQPLQDFVAHATLGAGGTPREARIAAKLDTEAGTAGFIASLSPAAEGGRALRLTAQNTGAMLSALGVVSPLEGGKLEVTATQAGDALGAPIDGTAELIDFAVHDAPAVGKLLQAITGFGLLDALNGPGLGFARLTAPFRFDDGTLSLGEARAFSASLGLTATGLIDMRRETLNLRGTVVPAYIFNSLLGNLPLVGGLFSAEKGGGLFSAGYEVHGPFGEPQVSVNPLSALTPGFLRRLFDLGGEDEGDAPEPGTGATSEP